MRLFVEPLMSEGEFAEFITPDDLAEAQTMYGASRRQEFLSWRAIVRRELGAGVRISYNDAGAPVVGDPGLFISVSHCKERVAVCISDKRCGVDIEPLSRDFMRVAPRYISGSERQLSENRLLPAVVWCAKEALYKYSGRRGLDLLTDLHIEAVDFDRGSVVGRIQNEPPVEMSLRIEEEFIVVVIK